MTLVLPNFGYKYVRVFVGCITCRKISCNPGRLDGMTCGPYQKCGRCGGHNREYSEKFFLANNDMIQMYLETQERKSQEALANQYCSHSSKIRTAGFDPYSDYTCAICGAPC